MCLACWYSRPPAYCMNGPKLKNPCWCAGNVTEMYITWVTGQCFVLCRQVNYTSSLADSGRATVGCPGQSGWMEYAFLIHTCNDDTCLHYRLSMAQRLEPIPCNKTALLFTTSRQVLCTLREHCSCHMQVPARLRAFTLIGSNQ